MIGEQRSYKSSIRPLCNDLLDLRLQNTANPVQSDSEYFNGSLFFVFSIFAHLLMWTLKRRACVFVQLMSVAVNMIFMSVVAEMFWLVQQD